MKRMTYMALIGLFTLFAALVGTVQPMMAQQCGEGPQSAITRQIRLEHAKPVTLTYQPGQTVTLAGDESGLADLEGSSVVAVEFSPSGKGLGYSQPPETLAAQDVTALLEAGENRVSLIAVDERDTAWLVVTSPCEAKEAEAQPTATATVEPAPTATESAIVTPTTIVRHTAVVTAATDASEIAQKVAVRDSGGQQLFRLLFILSATVLGLSILLGLLRRRSV